MRKKIGGFILGGGASTLVQFVVAGILSFFVWLPVTHVLGLISGITYNFFHQSHVFKSSRDTTKFTKFVGYSLCNAGAQSLLVFVFMKYHVPYFVGLTLAIGSLGLVSFLVYNFVIFSKS